MIIFIEFLLPAWPPAVMPMHFRLASCIYSHHICLFQGLVFINVKIKKSSFQREKKKRETQEQKHSIPVSYCLLFTVLKCTVSQFSN